MYIIIHKEVNQTYIRNRNLPFRKLVLNELISLFNKPDVST